MARAATRRFHIRIRTLMIAIAGSGAVMFLIRVRPQMNAFFEPVPLFDVSISAGLAIGTIVGFSLVWIRYFSLRSELARENHSSSTTDENPPPSGAAEKV